MSVTMDQSREAASPGAGEELELEEEADGGADADADGDAGEENMRADISAEERL